MTAALPGPLAIFQMATAHYNSHALYVAAKLGLADLLAGGPRHYQDLASATDTHAASLHRVMRLLALLGVFADEGQGAYSLTPAGEFLRDGVPGSARATVLLFAGPSMGAWEELLYCVQTGKPSFEKIYGTDPFGYLAQRPEEAAIFNAAMTASSARSSAAVAEAYDFSKFRRIVDVGGGHGALMATILKANPDLRGMVFDLPHVVEGARKRMEEEGLADRCEVAGGSFFESVPPGACAYVLRAVIHDWNDERSIAILRNVHQVMPAEAKLLLVELALPERLEASPSNMIAVGSDINMLVNTGGRERTEAEFRALYDASGFRLTRIIPTKGIPSVVEGAPL